MKFCPVCRQRFEDTQNFCLADGSVLKVFSTESQVPTANFQDLDNFTVKPTEASPTMLSPKQNPPLTDFSQKQDTPSELFKQIEQNYSVPPKKSNPLQIALLSILGTLCVVGVAAGAWWWLGSSSETSNDISLVNSAQKSSANLKTNTSNSLPTSNQIENSKPDKKSSNANAPNLTNLSNNKAENVSVNSTPTENSTVDLQVKFTDLGKTQHYSISGGSITIQTDGGKLTAVTNNAGIAYFKGVSCNKPVRITVKSEDGSGTFTRNPKCGANASWSYQTDCFVISKNNACVIEQVK